MSELAPSLHASELLSARDIATLLKITPRAVRLRMAGIAPVQREGIQAWPLDVLPPDYQMQLQFVKKRAGLWTFADMVRVATPRWEPDFKFASLPAFSQLKAQKVRAVMSAYFAVLDNDGFEHQANCAARQKWLEEFAAACSEKTIRNWAAKIEARGGIEWAPIEAYADRKSCPHLNARIEHREKKRVPAELIRAFKVLCTQPAMNIAAAYRKLEMDWQVGREVPGIGAMVEPRQPFPFKLTQLRKFAPSAPARKLGNQGNAAARRDTLVHMTRTYADLRPCEMYVMDDTRINVTALDDLNGKAVELKCYIAMEVASRLIVGYVIREGNMKASDVDALTARVLRDCGIAAPNAGYKTLLKFERGTVACSEQRQKLLEALYPGRLEISRTSMDGGQNYPGDYVQAASGHWMGKGVIESFMRTLQNITRHIEGQRGSERTKLPTMVGWHKGIHAGGMVDEAQKIVQAARSMRYQETNGVETAPHARETTEAYGLKLPLLFVSQFRQAFALAIESYNTEHEHRREGFRQLAREKENGGIEYSPESSRERWHYLVHQAEQHGRAPQRIAPADAALLLHKARTVTIRPNGAVMEVDGVSYRYFHPDSIACAEALRLSTVEKQYIAVYDPEDLTEIYLLKNPVSKWQEGDTPEFLECLPLYNKPGVTDKAAMGEKWEEQRRVHQRYAGELASVNADRMEQLTADREGNTGKFSGVITTLRSDYHEVTGISAALKSMKRKRRELVEKIENAPIPAAEPASRRVVTNSAKDELASLLKEYQENA